MAWRDWRSGDLRLLSVAVFLAVAALCCVCFFTDRLDAALARDAQQLIGGDAVVVSDQPLPADFAQAARGLRVTQMAIFPSMARASEMAGGAARLATLKAVDSAYPLRGEVRIQRDWDQPVQDLPHGPAVGEVWVDPELLVALNVKVGDTLLLGDTGLRVSALLVAEPDLGLSGLMNFSPRVLMNAEDLAATRLVQPASRVTYRFAIASEDRTRVQAFETWVQDRIAGKIPGEGMGNPLRGVRFDQLETSQPIMHATLERAQNFLKLVALLAALLSAVAVVIAARDFARRHLDGCALLRVLGLSQRNIGLIYLMEFGLVGVLASVAGVVGGWGLHYVFVSMLSQWLGHDLPAPGIWPVALGMGAGLTLLAAFGLPPVLQLAQVPPLRVLRRELGDLRPISVAVLALGVAGFMALLLAASGNVTLGLVTVGGFVGAVVLFAGLAYITLKLIQPLAQAAAIPVWLRLAVRFATARPLMMVAQVSTLAIGLLALTLLVLLRTDLIDSWQAATPPDAPDRFVISIMPDQAQAFQQMLTGAGVAKYDWYPMIRGRLVAVNDRAIGPEDYTDEQAQRMVAREFNLSYAKEAPDYNRVTQGQWGTADTQGASVESVLMNSLHLKLGDKLLFDVAGVPLERRITSVRELDWSSMHVNFFVMFPLQSMPEYPETYITAFKAPSGDLRFDDTLAQAFPNITSINVSALLVQVRGVLDQVIRAVEFLFMFTLAAGMLVLIAAMAATREQRRYDFAVMRALGASSRMLGRIQSAELLCAGALSGLLAALMAVAVATVLAHWVFEFSWSPSVWIPLAVMLAGALLAWCAGWFSLRSVLSHSVLQTLRTSSNG